MPDLFRHPVLSWIALKLHFVPRLRRHFFRRIYFTWLDFFVSLCTVFWNKFSHAVNLLLLQKSGSNNAQSITRSNLFLRARIIAIARARASLESEVKFIVVQPRYCWLYSFRRQSVRQIFVMSFHSGHYNRSQ